MCTVYNMRFKLISLSFLAILSCNICVAVVFRFSNLVCESYNSTTFVFHQCRLKAVSRDRVDMNVNGTILSSINDVTLHIRVFKRENGFKPWLFNFKFDGCRFMRKNYLGIAKLMFNILKDFSNLNHTCPYVGPLLVQGFYLRPELLLLPIPTGEYMIAVRWFYDDMLQCDVNMTFVYVEDNNLGKT